MSVCKKTKDWQNTQLLASFAFNLKLWCLVCAIQHVDVCMFNNGKFKNIVADSDNNSPIDRTVSPGGTLSATFILRPRRGPTKNWIALEDTLQRSTEPEEITGAIAASAIRSPTLAPLSSIISSNPDDRNVFAIYVSYYVKVKLTLSGIGGELSLKLPFVLVHVDDSYHNSTIGSQKLDLANVPPPRRNQAYHAIKDMLAHEVLRKVEPGLDRIESFEDELKIPIPENLSKTPNLGSAKRKLLRSETIAKDLSDDDENGAEKDEEHTQVTTDSLDYNKDVVIPRDDIHQNIFPDEEDDEKEPNEDDKDRELPSHQQIIYAQVHSDV